MTIFWTDYIPWVYISIQVSIALIVSIMGAKYVKNEYKRRKNKMQQMEKEINIQQTKKDRMNPTAVEDTAKHDEQKLIQANIDNEDKQQMDDLKRELLVWGYIRNAQKHYRNMNIPLDINDIIYLYQRMYDEWNEEYSSKCIKIYENKSMMLVARKGLPTVYGTHVVSQGIFIWKIKILVWNSTNFLEPRAPYVGITEDIDSHLKEYTNQRGWCTKGYELSGKDGSLTAADPRMYVGYYKKNNNYGAIWNKKGDILEIVLNLDKRTLSFKVNDKDFGVAFENIKVAKYRLAMSFFMNKGSKFVFVD